MVCKPVLVLLGKFDAKDLVFYFERLGIRLDLTDAEKLVQKYAKRATRRRNSSVSYSEWTRTVRWRSPTTSGDPSS